jgi:uncharacterized membrane protein
LTWEYFHLITHPFSIVLSIVAVGIGLFGWIRGSDELERFALVSLLIAAAFAIPSYISGISAADVVSERTFVQPGDVQTHRTWATWAALGLVTSGIFAGFAMSQRDDRRLRRFVILVGALAAALTSYAAFRGGKITHGEDTRLEPVKQPVEDSNGT